MKTHHQYLSIITAAAILLGSSCKKVTVMPSTGLKNNENTEPLRSEVITGTPNPFPTVTVIKANFSNATGWRITWKGGSYNAENVNKVPSIFSTINGSVHSVHYLNNTAWLNTDYADMQLYFGKLVATSKVPQLTKVNALKDTQFKLSNWNVATLEDVSKNNPNAFGLAFEFGFFGAAQTQTGNYSAGQVYLFKTDRIPAKYGAVRIVKTGGAEKIIEVVVQK